MKMDGKSGRKIVINLYMKVLPPDALFILLLLCDNLILIIASEKIFINTRKKKLFFGLNHEWNLENTVCLFIYEREIFPKILLLVLYLISRERKKV